MDKELQPLKEMLNSIAEVLSEIKATKDIPSLPNQDEIGMIDLAMRVTGLAKQTIYAKASQRKIPHFKRGKFLYFSANSLRNWIMEGKQLTRTEILEKSF